MNKEELASLHGKCFVTPRPWSTDEFHGFLSSKFCFLETNGHGFVLGRVIADEAEILTLAVDPTARRQGHGAALLAAYHTAAQKLGASDSFLEVSAENHAAIGLYQRFGYEFSGKRKNYYCAPDGTKIDANLMRMPIKQS